jgi:uncharacterized protein YeaO (DUF488 family)
MNTGDDKTEQALSMQTLDITVKRVYEPVEPDDGQRVLVDRLWPRGVSKQKAAIDEWLKDVTPSSELRKRFHDDKSKYDDFAKDYEKELKGDIQRAALDKILTHAATGHVTLVTAVSNIAHSHIPTLLSALEKRKK